MTELPDIPARQRALTDLDSTLLVEAAAGTGKTALMAGRLTMLLARGAEPRNIAAITFTELAASALSARIHRFVHELLAGRIPEPLRPALRGGLNAVQQRALSAAAGKLDELTTATIHAFCQTIISSYAVEADIDPGALILDSAQAANAFDAVFEQWLRRRLNGPDRPGDPIAILSRDDPHRVVATLQDLARFRLKHRNAQPLPVDLTGRPDIDLVEAVADFRRWTALATRRTEDARAGGRAGNPGGLVHRRVCHASGLCPALEARSSAEAILHAATYLRSAHAEAKIGLGKGRRQRPGRSTQ